MGLSFKSHPLYREDLSAILSVKGIERLSKKTVVLTGSTGLTGTQLVDALMKRNLQGAEINVIAVGRNEEKALERHGEYLRNRFFRFFSHDVTEPFPVSLDADYIIPLASFTHPVAYSRYPVATMMTNLKGAENALRLAERTGATLLYPSTVEIYGNSTDGGAFKETSTGQLDLSTSRACYTESKRACEALCQSFISEKGVCVKIARLCRVFGPSVLPDDSKASTQFISKALAKEDIVLKSGGNQFFSYIYSADAVRALLYIMLNGVNGEAYNVSSDACNVYLRDFAQACAEAAGKKVVFEKPSLTEQKGYSIAARAVLDNSRLRAIGWEPLYDFHSAVIRTIKILDN